MSEICDVCSASYDYIYWVPDHVWEKIKPLGRGDGGLLCLQCVHHRSKEAGFVLRFSGSDKWWVTDELTAARHEIETLKSGQIKTDNTATLVNALEEIEALKLANRDLQHWFDGARDEAERLRGLIAEDEIRKNEMRQVFICNPDGTDFRPSGHAGTVFYAGSEMTDPERMARAFHDCYERLAPEYGYVTREETRGFDPDSPNGQLMMAVCKEVFG